MPRKIYLYLFLTIFFFIGIYLSLRFGAVNFSNQELLHILQYPFQESKTQNIVIDIRFPRIIAAFSVGAALAISGAIMQAVMKNPIADPSILGINTGAALGLTIGYVLFKGLHYQAILFMCLTGASLTVFILFVITNSKNKGRMKLRLLLTGVMLTTLFNAIGQILMLVFNLSNTIIGWQSGGLIGTNWQMLKVITPIIILGMIFAFAFSHQLNLMSLNHQLSKSLGQNTRLITFLLLGIVLLLSASAVALAGSIAFIGLIIPHLVKRLVPLDYRYILPLTGIFGGTFLIWVDLISRNINAPFETSLSAIISIIGLPFFFAIVRREH